MPYVDSSSSYEEVRAAMLDNANWLVEGSLTKAKLFANAARVWQLGWATDRSKLGPSEQDLMSLNKLANDFLNRAESFVAANATSGPTNSRATKLSIRNFRGYV